MKSRPHTGIWLLSWFALYWIASPVAAAAFQQDGDGLLRMCRGADKVRALGVMCHSYLNGYIDAVAHYEKTPPFCVGPKDKERVPGELVSWLGLHPSAAKEPAPVVLRKALGERFPCRGRR